MPQVDLAYGPPPHHGVTTLMSVGDGLLVEPTPLEQAADRYSWWALGAALAGLATGNAALRYIGTGAYLALRAVRRARP